jgi:hypothetical protein
MMKGLLGAAVGGLAMVAMCGFAAPSHADTFNLTSCHITGGCDPAPPTFCTVTVTQSGTSVLVDVVLNSGNRFVETGAGNNMLFGFNDAIAGSTVTNITATLNGVNVTANITGGLSGTTNISPAYHADGTGDWTAGVFCTTASSCNGGNTPNFDDLHFTLTNITLAQLETLNPGGNMFFADILCGASNCNPGSPTGLVDVSTPAVPEPSTWGMMLLGFVGLGFAFRQSRRKVSFA